jgi:hypothetical protein
VYRCERIPNDADPSSRKFVPVNEHVHKTVLEFSEDFRWRGNPMIWRFPTEAELLKAGTPRERWGKVKFLDC